MFAVISLGHDDVTRWKHLPRYWPFVRGIHRSSVDSPHKSQRRGALMFSLICARTNSWASTRYAGDLGRHDVIVMEIVMYWYTHFWNCTRTNDCVPAALTDINKFWCDIIMWTPRFLVLDSGWQNCWLRKSARRVLLRMDVIHPPPPPPPPPPPHVGCNYSSMS